MDRAVKKVRTKVKVLILLICVFVVVVGCSGIIRSTSFNVNENGIASGETCTAIIPIARGFIDFKSEHCKIITTETQ